VNNINDAAINNNMVRNRANAKSVHHSKVTLDLILDECARELFGEYPRKYTLTRTRTFMDRVIKHNPVKHDFVKAYNALWPIAQSEIDENSGTVLEQNYGY